MTGWKLLTSDFRPPIQGGDPIFDGKTFPYVLPAVKCDSSDKECSYGWNFTADIATGLKIAGLWCDGRPSAVLAIECEGAIKRGDKLRTEQLTLLRHATDTEIRAGLLEFSKCFGEHDTAMAEEQWLWWQALKRPLWDQSKVEHGLQEALNARGLKWGIKLFDSDWDARDAWDAWDARDAWDAWAAWDAWDAWAAWDAWDAWAAKAAGAAWAALTLQFASRSAWVEHDRDLLTIGVRDAYKNGLLLVLPAGPSELGFVMKKKKTEENNAQ